jgi:hypothetical protein
MFEVHDKLAEENECLRGDRDGWKSLWQDAIEERDKLQKGLQKALELILVDCSCLRLTHRDLPDLCELAEYEGDREGLDA